MKKISIISIFVSIFMFFTNSQCERISEGSSKASKAISLSVVADLETEPLKRVSPKDDAADDPAIWINKSNPAQSRIIGTDKKNGLAVYDMQGKELFFYPDGRMNNVDVRYDFPFGNKKIDIVACSNRSDKCINLYQINADGSLNSLKTEGFESDMEANVYGFCLGKDLANNVFYAFANSKKGEWRQWYFSTNDEGIVVARIVRKFQFESKLEGMVCDDISRTVFTGEEDTGIWYSPIDPQSKKMEMIKNSDLRVNKNLKADIEGLAVYRGKNNKNYLLASSQGNYSYAIFILKEPYNYIGSFKITDGESIDGCEETDGIEATAVNLGKQFPDGIFIAQDGFNRKNKKLQTQNFKIVDWRSIQKIIDENLLKED